MTEGPLNESEMAWLEETLMSYGHDDASVIDVSELDGMLTAVLSGPVVVEPDTWLVAVWGGEKYIPRWKNDREMNRFIDLCFKHMNDIAERLSEYPDQFELWHEHILKYAFYGLIFLIWALWNEKFVEKKPLS